MPPLNLTSTEDEALRANLKILQKQAGVKIPGIDVPVVVDLPEINAPAGQVGIASATMNAADSARIPIPPTSQIGRSVVRAALQFRGIPYVWGGEDPNTGFDCSGLMQYVFRKYGVNIPRVTYDQFRAGTPVPLRAMRPGDLVFFHMGQQGPGHVGMYIGNNQFLQAPQTGDVVKISPLDTSHVVGVRRFG